MSQQSSVSDRFLGFTERRRRAEPTGNVSPVTPTRSPRLATIPENRMAPVLPRNSSPNPFVLGLDPEPAAESASAPPLQPFNPRTPEQPARVPTPLPELLPEHQPEPAPESNNDLASAIALLARTLSLNSRPAPPPAPNSATHERNNVRDPDQFDGSDATKLRSFFAQLELVFKARPKTFSTEEKKVMYAMSYLRGTVLQYFEPYLLESDTDFPPTFMTDYSAFQQELRINFGPYNAIGAAEHELESLRMLDSHRIAKYITQFSRLATQVQWGSAALHYQFYRGLPPRLKDRISELGKPDSILELRTLAQSLDARYWERKAEQSRETPSSSQPRSGGKPSSDSRPQQQKSSGTPTPSSSGSSSFPKSSTSTPKSTPKPAVKPYSDKLGKDGKLTNEERQRRFSENLCLFCGGPGHTATTCPKKTSSTKGRAAQASGDPLVSEPESESVDSTSPEPKN